MSTIISKFMIKHAHVLCKQPLNSNPISKTITNLIPNDG